MAPYKSVLLSLLLLVITWTTEVSADEKRTQTDLTSCCVSCESLASLSRLTNALSLRRAAGGEDKHSRGRAFTTAAHRRVVLTADSARPPFDNLIINPQQRSRGSQTPSPVLLPGKFL